jgi:hypothetical protein
MRKLIFLVFAMCVAALPSWSPSVRAAAPEKPEFKVYIPVMESDGFLRTNSSLHVIIENVSDKPQKLFEEWNSWGYDNLTLQWTDAQGKTGKVAKVPGFWTVNYPSTVVLQPGEAIVRDISFDPKLWKGWPSITEPMELKVKVSYQPTGQPKVPEADGWVGTVTSNERAINVQPPLSTQ